MQKTLNTLRRGLFLISMPMVFITFALPLRAEELGASGFEIGLLYSVFTASVFVIRPLVGFGLDQFGRRGFFILALVFYCAANALYVFSAGVETLIAARFIQGIGFSVLAITADTITADLTTPEERTAAIGGNIASQTRGGMAGAFVGFALVGAVPLHAWTFSFATFAVVALLAVIFAFKYIPETRPQTVNARQGLSFRFPREYYFLLLGIFLAAFATGIVQPYYLIYLRNRFGLDLSTLAAAFLPVGIAYALLPVWLGRLFKTSNRAIAMSVGFMSAGVLYAVVPHADGLIWVTVIFVGAAIGSVLVDITKNAWLSDIAGKDAVGRTFGVAALFASLGSVAGPLLGGAIYDHLDKEAMFYVAAFFWLTAGLLIAARRQRG